MLPIESLGRLLLIFGLLIAGLGLLLLLGGRIPLLGRLPGDVVIERDGVTIYIPIATSILLSVVISLLLMLAGALFGRQ